MAFIKSTTINNLLGNTTKGLYIGKTEAEGENIVGQGLREYYEDYLGMNDEFTKGKFIFTGRKGVGKSAFVKHLSNAAEDDGSEIQCSVVTNDKIDFEKILQAVPDDAGNKDQLIYEWIILTQFVKLIIKHGEGKYTNEFQALEKFEQKNSGLADVDKWMVREENHRNGLTVNFSDLLKVFPFAFSKEFNKSSMRAPFYALIPPLREIVVKMFGFPVCDGLNFIVIFDDLDINFQLTNEDHKSRLLNLIRVTKQYNTAYLPKTDQRVVLMLRDDISRQLMGVGPDKTKMFSSYEYNMNWYKSNIGLSDEDTILRKFINKRIGIAFEKVGKTYDRQDPWKSLVDETSCDAYRGKSAFKYILDYTFYRPRDLVAFFKDIEKKSFAVPLNASDINKQLMDYMAWCMDEIGDELSNTFSPSEIMNIFHVFERMSDNSKTGYADIVSMINDYNLPQYTFDTLLAYNYIIPKDDQDNQFFSYRERKNLKHKESFFYVLPKCIYKYYNRYN